MAAEKEMAAFMMTESCCKECTGKVELNNNLWGRMNESLG